ncbi:unnamed protein product [Protopolystoma xenopodis]|uniref:Uncharacterized protein n=1 Tax=Protopolystoma xenopodis TaxID=117903 RepID=A0A448XJB2_9PLAT|nr:unnamed protein product [Protopolystoma xenopodis]
MLPLLRISRPSGHFSLTSSPSPGPSSGSTILTSPSLSISVASSTTGGNSVITPTNPTAGSVALRRPFGRNSPAVPSIVSNNGLSGSSGGGSSINEGSPESGLGYTMDSQTSGISSSQSKQISRNSMPQVLLLASSLEAASLGGSTGGIGSSSGGSQVGHLAGLRQTTGGAVTPMMNDSVSGICNGGGSNSSGGTGSVTPFTNCLESLVYTKWTGPANYDSTETSREGAQITQFSGRSPGQTNLHQHHRHQHHHPQHQQQKNQHRQQHNPCLNQHAQAHGHSHSYANLIGHHKGQNNEGQQHQQLSHFHHHHHPQHQNHPTRHQQSIPITSSPPTPIHLPQLVQLYERAPGSQNGCYGPPHEASQELRCTPEEKVVSVIGGLKAKALLDVR